LNAWVLGGIANIGFVVFFVSQRFGDTSNLNLMTHYPDYASGQYVVVVALVVLAAFCFYKGAKSTKEK
jgi:hypothetical protein